MGVMIKALPSGSFVVVIIHTLLAESPAKTSNGCPPQFFGLNCQYKCRCAAGNCDQEGACSTNQKNADHCQKGWFGPGCQYALAKTDLPEWLTDNDEKTCNPQGGHHFMVRDMSLILTWIRMVFNTEVTDVNISLSDPEGKICKDMVSIKAAPFVLDIYCAAGSKHVTLIQLDGSGIQNLCSMYISQGRLISLKQNVSESNILHIGAHALVTDASVANQCGRLPSNAKGSAFVLLFSDLHRVTRYEITTAKAKHLSMDFDINVVGTEGKQHSVTDHGFLTTEKSTAVFSWDSTNIVKLIISPHNRTLTLCNVALYGDIVCPDNSYGLRCHKQCQCPSSRCHPATGACMDGCFPGTMHIGCGTRCNKNRYGQDCAFKCSERCWIQECHHVLGTCISDCIVGFTGPFCESKCTRGSYGKTCAFSCPVCKNDNCHYQTGECLSGCSDGFYEKANKCAVCPPGTHGPNCTKSCSPLCLDYLCENVHGFCFNCTAGFYGKLCENKCPEGTYGQDCAETCSPNCLAQACDKLYGICDNCKDGYEGDFCDKRADSKLWSYVYLTAFVMVCVIVYTKSRKLVWSPLARPPKTSPPLVLDGIEDEEG